MSLNERGGVVVTCSTFFTLLLFSIANDTAVRIAKFHRAKKASGDETDFVPVH